MGESSDPRFDFIQDFTLKSLRLKPDKWSRMLVSDEQRTFLSNFVDRAYPQVRSCFIVSIRTESKAYFTYQELVISQNFSGHLVIHTDWPSPLKNKGVYFVKREPQHIPREAFLDILTCGDIHPNSLDHFCAWVEEVNFLKKL